jgi:F0F1-type ATP synthase assembly protein I
MTPTKGPLVPPRDAITGGFSPNADLISYIVAGLLLGLVLDRIVGTTPVMVIIWALIGTAVGFYKLWRRSEHLDEEGKRRSHGV